MTFPMHVAHPLCVHPDHSANVHLLKASMYACTGLNTAGKLPI